ncbi:hypothetical protein [uncultured Capnocytophaga sp.]|uniref:hypothetical protein n=1 Tax=uncultured Capnocytophaga sp. TaxID=159273 RepID=UPI0028EE7217|nr:hypothetical protein [uncultured Capnocytophaga sp.]
MNTTKASVLFGIGLFISFIFCFLYLLDCSVLESITFSAITSFLSAVTWFKTTSYFLHKK